MSDRSISYAPIAAVYERVRGGTTRADELAAAVEPWLPTGVVCDVGAGTGVVTERFARADRTIIALDLSIEMLLQARDRLPGRLAVTDATRLPIATGMVDAVTYVWVLHHIADLEAALREAHRVLRPGGRVVAVVGASGPAADDMAPIFERLSDELDPGRLARAWSVPTVAREVGFEVVAEALARTTATVSPNGLAESIEQRLFSHLWDVPDARWSAVVEPAVAELRRLPEPDRPRRRSFDHPLVVLDR